MEKKPTGAQFSINQIAQLTALVTQLLDENAELTRQLEKAREVQPISTGGHSPPVFVPMEDKGSE